ncbi:MAG: amidohydrolase [Flammeovirgaceae bacterium]|nr:amidohydrolase [Flammeovirgaceae bacterium]
MTKRIKYIYLIFLCILIFSSSCQHKEKADLLIYNGLIYSVDVNQIKVEAVAVKAGKIWKIGDYKDIIKYLGEDTKLIDLKGKTMFPGFIEGHAHIMGIGANLMNLDLMGTTSYSEIVNLVAAKAKTLPEGDWIIGRGWHQDKWDNKSELSFKGFPSNDLLNDLVPKHPVYLTHASGHLGLANAKAMEILKIDDQTVDPYGGEIFKGFDGQPTGIFNETAHTNLRDLIPKPTEQWLENSLKRSIDHILANGITSFHEAGSLSSWVELYHKLLRQDELKIRLYVMLSGDDKNLLADYFAKGIFIDSLNRLTIRSVKLYADGALGSRGAWLLKEYSDAPGKFGHNVRDMEVLDKLTREATEAGFQVCTHAIGDRGNREVLDMYARAFKTFPEKKINSRFRIEHAQHISKQDLIRFKELGVIPAMQSIHMASDRPWAIDRLGKGRINEGAYVWQKFLELGVPIVNGSDAPVEPINPLASFYAAVTRKTLKGMPEGGYEPNQRMSRMQALKSYTIDAAYAAFEEDIKGSIEVGKLADFTILDKDIMSIKENEILNTQVEMTIVGGRVLYERKKIKLVRK